ncbi:MAG: family 78 glycoside hydrolase catalytic domain [Candidatus Lokiarchaeota archaeon]|nr:family 78 glycoside hydrolase catalytic domain [Candidatus Lokiarchaeota archaeon]
MIKPPFDLKCEYLVNPICIDVKKPRFSWKLTHEQKNQRQSAYQIIISSNKALSEEKNGDLWDSGKVEKDSCVNVSYKGVNLKSDSKYYWRIKWWDNDSKESEYSTIQKFETSLLEKSDWKAQWISKKEFIDKQSRKKLQYKSGGRNLAGRIKEVHALYLRKEFSTLKPIKSAKVYVCGLGYYELHINGQKIGDRILEPAQTDYNKLALYSTYDISAFIQKENAIGVVLGNGRCLELFGYDFPKVILQVNIHYNDDSKEIICTDNSWKISNGPIKENGMYFGEIYDARLEMIGWNNTRFDDKEWKNASVVVGHNLASQMMQPIQITKIVEPREIYSPEPGMYIIDFKQNFTGFMKLKVTGPRSSEVKLRFSEIVFKNGTLNTATNGNAPATDIYILKGEGEEIYVPHFTYHGFRYVEITGFPGVPSLDNFEGLFFHSNVPKTGNFYCSDTLINQIHSNIIWGQLSNLMSIPTDCPQRDERHGWMGDAQLAAEEAILNFDMARFFSKYLRDIRECQKEDGSISDVVPPYWSLYPADPAWGSAYITIAWYLYWYYNDIRVLEENYEGMRNYIGFLISKSEDNLFLMGKFGDWCPPCSIVSRKTSVVLTSSWYFYHDTFYFSKIAEILGKKDDHLFFKNKSEEIKAAFNRKFLNVSYETTTLSPVDRSISQTSNILPLYLKMVPDEKRKKVLSILTKAIIEDYDYHVDTGIVGTRYLFDVLSENDHPEIAYKIITQESFPSYGYMIKEGATTLWERWEKLEGGGMNSHNHIMLGSVDTWFYKTLTGIKCESPGWESVKIKPFLPDDMDYARSTIQTCKGALSCSWEKLNNSLKVSINIPVGMKAETWIPIDDSSHQVKESGTVIWKENKIVSEQIRLSTQKENSLVFTLGSGFYTFEIK